MTTLPLLLASGGLMRSLSPRSSFTVSIKGLKDEEVAPNGLIKLRGAIVKGGLGRLTPARIFEEKEALEEKGTLEVKGTLEE